MNRNTFYLALGLCLFASMVAFSYLVIEDPYEPWE